MIRTSLILAFVLTISSFTSAQQTKPAANPFGNATEESDWKPLHPDGDTPHERMLSLVHTESLPRFDRAELFAISMPKPFSDEKPKRKPTKDTFPVRPYGVHADVLARKTITADACDELRNAWQSLAFDRLGGAMCHYPVYAVRLHRNDDLLFETTICWECQNFYVPRYDSEKRTYDHGWYGFGKDGNSEALMKLFRSLLPHPKL